MQRFYHHSWGEIKYDPEIKREPYGYKLVSNGNDAWGWWEPKSYHDVELSVGAGLAKRAGKSNSNLIIVPNACATRYIPIPISSLGYAK